MQRLTGREREGLLSASLYRAVLKFLPDRNATFQKLPDAECRCTKRLYSPRARCTTYQASRLKLHLLPIQNQEPSCTSLCYCLHRLDVRIPHTPQESVTVHTAQHALAHPPHQTSHPRSSSPRTSAPFRPGRLALSHYDFISQDAGYVRQPSSRLATSGSHVERPISFDARACVA